jgi:hypothetical protein
MAERVPFLLRLDPELMAALRRWASDDLRSLNSQIEFLLRRAVVTERRLPAANRGRNQEEDRGVEPPGGPSSGP